MDLGAILLPASTAERHPAAPVDTALRITVIIAIPPVRGASTAIPSTAEARLVPAAAHPPTTMGWCNEGNLWHKDNRCI